jgi:hypothetical protein
LSIAERNDIDEAEESTQTRPEKRKDKKLPKRRKDYK